MINKQGCFLHCLVQITVDPSMANRNPNLMTDRVFESLEAKLHKHPIKLDTSIAK
jgi:hypothetical protein